jgi:pimeloyl-ACP methyl ester carboxylesterase
MATYVLIHGAWHGGWCWKKLTPLLRGAGHEVFTPTLTGLGERAHLASPEVDLSTHIQDVVAVLEYEDLRDVILVGHSYGGMVITGTADQVPERLAHLVYLDAYVPSDGQAMVDLSSVPNARERWASRVHAEGAGWGLPSLRAGTWDDFVRDVYGVTDEDERRWMVERLGPHPFKAMTQPVQLSNPVAADLPRTYIRCLEYENAAFDRYALAARAAAPLWNYRSLPTSHDAMVTMPEGLAELLLEPA